MAVVKEEQIVPYTQRQMYDLVNDVDQYSEFLPWCSESTVISKNQHEIRAELTLSASGMQKSFTTANRLHPHKMIEIHLVQGPFKHLHGFWHFEPRENDRCCVKLNLEFEFSNKLLGLMFGPVFSQVAHQLVKSFEERAHQVYQHD